ncbi:glycerate kinase [Achromobacter seleniivolatilans]|uniref:Glycerate kinase n=1 Tax=Achromobacter seleniivolatilans TaxID=3047478 RepID=A0ABY9LUM0_9BURK|nr:glycerate kinase [Achromobacter sp. R39]WMD18479.1 glycerate kinase [Achromobacter sp. R39]
MKIVIAPDSFKESVSAPDAAAAIARGVKAACPGAHTVCVPMADGGEGTVEAVLAATGGKERQLTVNDALGHKVDAIWGLLEDGTAVIEMAAAAGLELISPSKRDPMRASSHGVGELILAAVNSGATRIILGLGGSATNDGGAGMLTALGVRLLDADGRSLPPGGGALDALASIDTRGLDPRLANIRIDIASDVDNPLCGPEGASHVFGPQKGASPEQVLALDQMLGHFADICAQHLGADHRNEPGAGAAGGLGFAAKAFLQAHFRPGVDIVAELGGLAAAIEGATLVFTGEGRIDAQTLRGKTPAGVARIAQRAGVPVVALAGSLGPGYEALHACGISAAFSLAPGPITLQQALTDAERLLSDRARDVMQLWMSAQKRML